MQLKKWLWPSTKPGTSVRPARSVTAVSGPASFITSARPPTATILPPAIATASAVGWAALTVTIGPPRMIRSAGPATAGCPAAASSRPIRAAGRTQVRWGVGNTVFSSSGRVAVVTPRV